MCLMSNVELSKDALEQAATRAKYLEALGKALGVDENVLKITVPGLIAQAHELAVQIDYTTKHDRRPSNITKIRNIGEMFLAGSRLDYLKFPVGCYVLALLKEDPQGRIFKDLTDWVGKWTDGTG